MDAAGTEMTKVLISAPICKVLVLNRPCRSSLCEPVDRGAAKTRMGQQEIEKKRNEYSGS